MSVLSVCLLETTVYVLVKVGVSPCKGSSQAVFFCCCKDENPNVLHTNWDWFRYYIVNMCLASNDNINKRITLHECFNFERQSWHEPGNLEVKNVSPYSLSTSYRRGSWLLILGRSLMIGWRKNSWNPERVPSVFTFVCVRPSVCPSVCDRLEFFTLSKRKILCLVHYVFNLHIIIRCTYLPGLEFDAGKGTHLITDKRIKTNETFLMNIIKIQSDSSRVTV